MATATKTTKKRTIVQPVEVDVPTVTLELTGDEATTLAAILSRVGGSPVQKYITVYE